jgi:photosystem II stability/assembly factor-like uncharacterized protein
MSSSVKSSSSLSSKSSSRSSQSSSSVSSLPVVVSDCSNLGEVGKFVEITPAEVKAGIGQNAPDGQRQGGPFAMVVDPVNQGTVYSGTLLQGVWKSTDCGATWRKMSEGTNGFDVNRGMNWTFEIDPYHPNVLYTNSGYGSNGLFKSIDGGENWIDIWSPASQPVLSKFFQYNFANVVAVDPWNSQHILLTFHEGCWSQFAVTPGAPPYEDTCIVESFDGGSSWDIIAGKEGWNGGEGQIIFFLDSSSTWLWGSQNNGFWRTEDSGQTWQQIPGMATSHLQGTRMHRAKDGTFYVPAGDGIWRSPDGKANTWELVPGTGPIVGSIVSDGTTMYASTCYGGGVCDKIRFLKSPETDGRTWTEIPNPPNINHGGNLSIDVGHKLLFSSNLLGGLWRIRVE